MFIKAQDGTTVNANLIEKYFVTELEWRNTDAALMIGLNNGDASTTVLFAGTLAECEEAKSRLDSELGAIDIFAGLPSTERQDEAELETADHTCSDCGKDERYCGCPPF